jgi:hypothetical protein
VDVTTRWTTPTDTPIAALSPSFENVRGGQILTPSSGSKWFFVCNDSAAWPVVPCGLACTAWLRARSWIAWPRGSSSVIRQS